VWLAGFVLYQVLGANKSGDEISRRIVEKLRTAAPKEFKPDQRLNAKQVERLLEHGERLKALVGEQDFRLLKQALTQQFVISLVVYLLGLGFCAWSVYLFAQPTPKPASVPDTMNIQNSVGDHNSRVISSGSGSVNVDKSPPPAAQPPKRPGGEKK